MNLIKSTTTFSFFTLVSRIFGYLRDLLLAIYLGSGPVADAFFVAFRIPNTFRRLFSEGTFNAAFVPSYSSELAIGKKNSQKFANKIFNSAQTLFSTPNSPPEGRTPLALEEKEQTSFMEQRPPIISDAELTALEQGSDINTYSISEPEEDVKPFDPVQNRRQRRRQRRLKAATR